MHKKILTLTAMSCALTACAEVTSIYHNRTINGSSPRVITLDAKQRNLVIVPANPYITGVDGKPQDWRMCAEAAPDVFSALSASASGALEADVTARKGKAAAAVAVAEAASTIERTQTVNLLRESMYRTCERYISGALDKTQFIVQAARDQRSMVAVLAIEQLTRTVRPPATVIAAPSTGATVPDPALIELIADFRKQEQAAQADVDTANANYKSAGGPDTCAAARPADDSGTIKQAAWDACDKAKSDLAAKNTALAAATDRVNKALAINNGGNGGGVGASTGAGTVLAGGSDQQAAPVAISQVADAVARIADTPGIDEPLMFCIGFLGETHPADDQRVIGCLDILKSRSVIDNKRAQGLFGGDAPPDAQVEDLASRYAEFKAQLLARIVTTPDSSMKQKIVAFEDRAGLNGIATSVPDRCATQISCARAVQGEAYYQLFSTHAAGMTSGLTEW